ncbi:MAG: MFS transporter [Chloroflexi bacterium]|nr:MFS transporter [Chloroflexota bacterium]
MTAPVQERSTSGAKAGRYRYVIAGLTMLYHFTFGLSIFVVAPLTPLIMEDYGINRSTASLLIGLVLLLQAAIAIPGGMLGSKLPLKWVIAAGWLTVSVTIFSFAAPNFAALLALRIVYGIASSLVFPNVGPLVMQWFPVRQIPLVNALNSALISLGMATSTFAAGPLAEAIGWRATLSLFGVTTLAGAGAWMVLGRTRTPDAETGQAGRAPQAKGGSFTASLGLLKSKPVLLMATGNAAAFAQYGALTSWLPTYYHEEFGMSVSKAAAMMGILPLVGVASLLSAGVLSTRVRQRRPFLLVSGVLSGFAGFGAVILGNSALALPVLVLVGFSGWFYQPILFAMPMELPGVTSKNVSVIFGLFMLVGGIVGFLSPLLVGASADFTGSYLWGFGALAIISWGLALAAWKLPETGR